MDVFSFTQRKTTIFPLYLVSSVDRCVVIITYLLIVLILAVAAEAGDAKQRRLLFGRFLIGRNRQ